MNVVHMHILFCFVSLCPLSVNLSFDKVCHYCISFNCLLSGKFEALLWVFACTVVLCGWAENDQTEFLRVENFRGLSAGTANCPLDVGSWQQFQRVHESTLLTRTCSACSGIKKQNKYRMYVNGAQSVIQSVI